MYLESIELQGFKSFPDKIKLTFDKGVTAVVGPNGSGKSNIGDAVRWVLGEQSSKTLRGAKMEDVIFAGTQRRKALGFALVTLNIVNSRHLLPVDSERVSVTRKLYRSGESEYSINGSQVRLKDVCELFMDTGLGRDGYSIIGQGRVAEIVSAKSNERREIFEEAAGISKFRYKKAEAERRLSAAEENILRLRDIIGELEGRVEPLRIQSEKAEKYLAYSETRKSLEITVWVNQLGELKKTLDEIGEKLLINTNEYNGFEADINRLENEIQSTADKLEAGTLHIEELRSSVLETERSNTQLHADIAVCNNDISHCNEAIADIEERMRQAEGSGEENRAEIAKRLEEVKAKDAEISETKTQCEHAENELAEILTGQTGFEAEFNEVNSELNRFYISKSEYNITLSTGEASVGELEAGLAAADAQDENLRIAAEELSREKKEAEDGLSMLGEKLSELNNRSAGLTKLRSVRAEKLSAAQKEAEEIGFTVRDKEQRIKLLTDLENSMEGFAHSVKQVLRAAKTGRLNGVEGSVAQLIRVDNKYSTAIEIALGGALQNIIVKNEDAAKRGIRLLIEDKAGRATFLPISSVNGRRLTENGLEGCGGFISLAVDAVEFSPEYTGIFNSLLGRIVLAEDIDAAGAIAKKYGYKFKIVTLDGQVVNAGGSFTGGSVAKSGGVLTRKNDIERLTAERDALSAKLEPLKQVCARLKAECEKMGFDIEAVREELQDANGDKIRFEAELTRIEAMSAQNGEARRSIAISRGQLEEKKAAVLASIKLTREKLAECSAEIERAEKTVSANEELRRSIQEKRDGLSGRLSELKLKEASLSKDKDAVLAEIKRLEEQSASIGDSSARLALELERQREIIAQKEQAISELNSRLDGSKSAVEEINARIALLRSEQRAMEQSSNEMRSEERLLSEKKEKYSREISRLEERKASLSANYDKIIADMSEQYSLYLSDALEIAKPVGDILAVQRDLADIKQKIRALGTVNVAAVEEYKEVSERYGFMSGQLNDVETSKRELEKLIGELTDTMRRKFSESFGSINENFKSVFTELFGGGHAELSLSEPDDVLESGIEINVAPPGKVIKSLSLLSGGEQAFVAIAIYFAILKLKPAPFCILDEIEAALDDINVTKYAQYLRRFTDTTQFIVVTHRRGTMDEADVMYGVTMQEKGISKILKLEQPPADFSPALN